MEVVDDTRLMELARDPARELLPAARRESVVRPLIVLLAFLPGLLGFWNRSPDESMCRFGLHAFDVAMEDRPLDWLASATREASERSSFGSPLAILLTAVGLKIELFSPVNRLLLVSYLSSVLLLLCLGGLAQKVGGHRFALLTVCLACGHRELLALSESLPPAALPLALALLSSREWLVHQLSGGPLVSWSLVASSLALAASWLSGGESALASWCVLSAVSLWSVFFKGEPSSRSTLGRMIRHRISGLMSASMSLFLVTLMAAVIVVGWQYAFSQKLSLTNFTEGFFWPRKLRPVEFPTIVVATNVLVQAMGAWLGFVLLGVLQAFRSRTDQLGRASTLGTGFLIVWTAVAWLGWWATGTSPSGEAAQSSVWAGWRLLPLLFLAAQGLDAVLRREIGLGRVLSMTLVTLGVISSPHWVPQLSNPVTRTWLAACVLTGGIIVWVGWLKVSKSEFHTRLVLLSCVGILVLADLASGLFSWPRLADDERELLALRHQLTTEVLPDECWLVTEETPPARLRFFLRSLWSDVAVREARDWEAVLPKSLRDSSAKAADNLHARAIVVTWGNSKAPAEDLKRRGQVLTQITAPHYFQGRLVKGYRWAERGEGASSR